MSLLDEELQMLPSADIAAAALLLARVFTGPAVSDLAGMLRDLPPDVDAPSVHECMVRIAALVCFAGDGSGVWFIAAPIREKYETAEWLHAAEHVSANYSRLREIGLI